MAIIKRSQDFTEKQDIESTYTTNSAYVGGGMHLFILAWVLFTLCLILWMLTLINYTQGLDAFLYAGGLIGIAFFLACCLIAGILFMDNKTYFTVNHEGLTIQETYIGGVGGKPVILRKSDILRIYTNASSKFPYYFIVYMRNRKKKYIGLDKSEIKDYKKFLFALGKIVVVINEGIWKYRDVKNAESKRDS